VKMPLIYMENTEFENLKLQKYFVGATRVSPLRARNWNSPAYCGEREENWQKEALKADCRGLQWCFFVDKMGCRGLQWCHCEEERRSNTINEMRLLRMLRILAMTGFVWAT